MSTPLITVLMSVYNGKRYVPEAVESVLSQTHSDFEFIIIDDGSTDGVSEILRDYAARDQRIRLIAQENQGLTRSLNNGLAAASGKYIARIDADDVCLPERLSQQAAFLDEHPDHVAVGSSCYTIDGEGSVTGERLLPTDHETIDRENLSGNVSLIHPAIMIRRSAAESIGGYDESIPTCQDLDIFLRLAETGRIANLPIPLINYRWHDNNESVRLLEQHDRDVAKILASAHERRGLPIPYGIPVARWQFRRVMARKYAVSGDWGLAVFFGWQAIRVRPRSLRSWYSLLYALLRGGVARIS